MTLLFAEEERSAPHIYINQKIKIVICGTLHISVCKRVPKHASTFQNVLVLQLGVDWTAGKKKFVDTGPRVSDVFLSKSVSLVNRADLLVD